MDSDFFFAASQQAEGDALIEEAIGHRLPKRQLAGAAIVGEEFVVGGDRLVAAPERAKPEALVDQPLGHLLAKQHIRGAAEAGEQFVIDGQLFVCAIQLPQGEGLREQGLRGHEVRWLSHQRGFDDRQSSRRILLDQPDCMPQQVGRDAVRRDVCRSRRRRGPLLRILVNGLNSAFMLSKPVTKRRPQHRGELIVGSQVLAKVFATLLDPLAKAQHLLELRSGAFRLRRRHGQEIQLDPLHLLVGNQVGAQLPFLLAARAVFLAVAPARGRAPTIAKDEHGAIAAANVFIDQILWPTEAGHGVLPADRLEHHVARDRFEPVVFAERLVEFLPKAVQTARARDEDAIFGDDARQLALPA